MSVKFSERMIYFVVLFFSFAVIAITKNIFMPNTGDFGRAIGWYVSYKPVTDIFLTFKIEDVSVNNFLSGFEYKSSYTVLVYCYTYILSLFTDAFDLRLLSSILKIIYIFSLFFLFSTVMRLKHKTPLSQLAVFFIAITPCISSSNLAFFSSFYQEQVVLICLPVLLLCLIVNTQKSFLLVVATVTIISCSKSQFFYLPIIVACYYFLYSDKCFKKILTMIAIFAFACMAIFKTTGTTELNKYHATYFGIYQFADMNGYELPSSIEKTCIGVDAWGNKFNIEDGAVYSNTGMECYIKLKDKVSFLDVIDFFAKNPLSIISLPFDKGILPQLSESYFHVYYSYKIIGNNTGPLGRLTSIKDDIFHGNRLPILFLIFPLSILFRKKENAGVFFIASSFAISQFYIAFFGEGYRDLSKHLFAMNFAFDLMVSVITVVCVVNGINKLAVGRDRKRFMNDLAPLN